MASNTRKGSVARLIAALVVAVVACLPALTTGPHMFDGTSILAIAGCAAAC
jgi:hypothetical protein